jgi:hypothetical protein
MQENSGKQIQEEQIKFREVMEGKNLWKEERKLRK